MRLTLYIYITFCLLPVVRICLIHLHCILLTFNFLPMLYLFASSFAYCQLCTPEPYKSILCAPYYIQLHCILFAFYLHFAHCPSCIPCSIHLRCLLLCAPKPYIFTLCAPCLSHLHCILLAFCLHIALSQSCAPCSIHLRCLLLIANCAHLGPIHLYCTLPIMHKSWFTSKISRLYVNNHINRHSL